MKNKPNAMFVLFLFSLINGLIACRTGETKVEDKLPATEPAGTADSLTGNWIELASTITYDVVIRNPDPDDTWTESCLAKLNRETLIGVIFDAVTEGRLSAWNYHSEEKMDLNAIRQLERDEEFDRSLVSKVQFIEEWYLDPEKLVMTKRVKSIMLAYEVYDRDGKIRGYKAAFRVDLN